MTSHETFEPTTRPAIPDDPVHGIWRKIVGFTTTIHSGCDEPTLRASIEDIACASAFDLEALDPVADGTGLFEARFVMRAQEAAGGDAQIFVVLRALAERHRWDGLSKHIRR